MRWRWSRLKSLPLPRHDITSKHRLNCDILSDMPTLLLEVHLLPCSLFAFVVGIHFNSKQSLDRWDCGELKSRISRIVSTAIMTKTAKFRVINVNAKSLNRIQQLVFMWAVCIFCIGPWSAATMISGKNMLQCPWVQRRIELWHLNWMIKVNVSEHNNDELELLFFLYLRSWELNSSQLLSHWIKGRKKAFHVPDDKIW